MGPTEPKKGSGRFAMFSRRTKPAATMTVAAPATSDITTLFLPEPSSSAASRRSNQTLSTAATLAQPHVGSPLGMVPTHGSTGSSAIETMQSPVPPFGSQRRLFFPITVLAAPVLKKASKTLSYGQDTHSQVGLSISAHARGDWKKRVVAISYWTAQTRNVSAVTGEEEGLSFGTLHLFKTDGPSGKEVGRMRIGYNSLVGLLDPSTPGGVQAEGRKHVLRFTAGQRPEKDGSKHTKEVFGEADELLVVQMESEEVLQAWVTEIKAFIFVKRAEERGIGNAARVLRERGEILSGDVEILLANLAASEAKKHATRQPSEAASVLSVDTTLSAVGRPAVSAIVIETHDALASADDLECRRWQEALAACVGVGGETPAAGQGDGAECDSAQAAALATDSLQQLILTDSQLPTSMTSSSLGSSTAAAADPTALHEKDGCGPSPTALSAPPDSLPPSVTNRPQPTRELMPSSTDLSYSYTFDAKSSPLPAFGCLRAALIPITVLAVGVDKKISSSGNLDLSGPLSVFTAGKHKPGVWRRRHLVLTSWNAVIDHRRLTFGCLHLFDKSGPSALEVGRLMLHASSLVGWLDASAANGQEADGRKYVLSVLPKAASDTAPDSFGEIDGRLLVDMLDETTLKTWIAELKKLAFINRAEVRGLGDAARKANGKAFGDDLDHALHLLSESSLDAPSTVRETRPGAPALKLSSPSGRRRLLDSTPPEPASVGERSEVSFSDHSSYQLASRSDSSTSLNARLRELSSVPMTRDGSSSPAHISRPVLTGSSNADVARYIKPSGTLPPFGDTDVYGSTEPTSVAPRATESDYHAFENILASRLHARSPLSDRFSMVDNSVEALALAELDVAEQHRAEIERLRRVEVELRQQLEIERLRAVESDLRAELKAQRKRREEQQRWQVRPDYDHDGLASDDSDVDPRGPTPRNRSIGSSAYSRSSFAGQSDMSAWDASRNRQNSATTAGSSGYGSEREFGLKATSVPPPVTSLSRQASSKFSSGPTTPLDEEDAASIMRPRSSSRSSCISGRPSGLVGDYGMAPPLASPVRPAKVRLGPPPAPPPATLPPPPPTSVETSRNHSDPVLHDGGTRSYSRRPSATLGTLNERPMGSGRGRAALLRQFAVPPITSLPPSGPLPLPK